MELKLGSIPLRIQGGFFLMALFLGMSERDPVKLGIWVLVVFVSIVVHELGHALAGKAFGLVPRIELHGMGGLTQFTASPTSRGELGTGKSIAISVAGPFAGFAFAAGIAAVRGYVPPHPLAAHAISMLLLVNIVWGLFNLAPMLPLDGGNVMRAALSHLSRARGETIARVVSVAFAATLALWSLTRQSWWLLFLGVLFAFQNVQGLRHQGRARERQALAGAVQESLRALEQQQPEEALRLVEPALASGVSPEIRQVALRARVAAFFQQGRWGDAMAVIERERSTMGAEDLAVYAEVLRDNGRAEDAARVDALAKEPPAMSDFRS